MARIILCTDLSDAAASGFEAVHFLEDILPLGEAELEALYVAPSHEGRSKEQEFFARVHQTTPDRRLRCTLISEKLGVAFDILDYAKRANAEMLVLSTHGRTGWRRLFSGSVAEAVCADPPCPVLVVPSSYRHAKKEVMHLMFATDLSVASERMFAIVSRIFSALGSSRARLTILYLAYDISRATFSFGLGEDRELLWEELEDHAKSRMAALMNTYFQGTLADSIIARAEKDLPDEISGYAQAHLADLLIMGVVDTAENIGRVAPVALRHLHSPALIVPVTPK